MSTFGRTIKMESLLGKNPKWDYENAYFEEEASTMKEAIALVEKAILDYKMEHSPNPSKPFRPTEVGGVKMLSTAEFLGKDFENKSCVGCGKPKPNCSC